MRNKGHAIHDQMAQLTNTAGMLLPAKDDIAGHSSLGGGSSYAGSFINQGWEFCGRIRENAIYTTKAAKAAFSQNPFQAGAVAIGVCALIAYFLALRFVCDRI